jgi:transcriptional regulator GlxA family with amidase domain
VTLPHRQGFLLLPRFSLLALGAATEVLAAANEVLEEALYTGATATVDGRAVRAGSGTLVQPTHGLADAPEFEAIFVVSESPLEAVADEHHTRLGDWLRARAAQGCVLGGIGSGTALLAQAGLLNGHRATLHWALCEPLAQAHPQVVVSNNVYEIDPARLSCGGGTAALDMIVAWLGQRHGERVAQALAAHFGLERIRARDDKQIAPLAARAGIPSAKLAEAVALMEANLGEPLPTEDIAQLVGVSRRQLERLFKQHMDALPSRWYAELRLARARRLLQQTSQSILQVGLACGFSSGSHFSNAYRARFGRTPREERSQRAAAWRDHTEVNPA